MSEGRPTYGPPAPPYGPGTYPPPAYGPPPYGPPPAPQKRKHSGATAFLTFVVILAVILVGIPRITSLLGPAIASPDMSHLVRTATSLPQPVSSTTSFPTPGFEESGSRLMPAVSASGGSYAFSETQPSGDPVTWSPCRPVHVVVNTSGAPDGFVDHVLQALGTASDATGLVFVYDGETTERSNGDREAYQPERYGDRWAPVLIQIADEDSFPGLEGDIAGTAGPTVLRNPNTNTSYAVTGLVTLDADGLLDGGTGRVPGYVPVLRHELGHLIGLDHVDDRDELMYPEGGSLLTYQEGYLTGLAILGRGACTASY